MSELADGRAGLRQPASYLPELESLRGWAILLVVAFHYYGVLGLAAQPDLPAWLRVLGGGNSGVTLFFVLSGFLLSRPFIDGLRSGRQVSIGRFYSARLFRIVPLYYGAVLIAWLVTQKTVALKALLFVPIGFQAFPYSVPWWSLCTEIQFYLLLPWVMWLLRFGPGRWLVAVGFLCWATAHLYLFHLPGWLSPVNPWENSIFGRGGAFLTGIACAWLRLSPAFTWLARRQTLALLLVIGGLALLLRLWLWFALAGERPALQAFPMYHNLEALLWGGVMLGLLALRGWGKGLLVNPLLDHAGRLSFSIYLVHVPLQFYLIYPLISSGIGFQADPGAYLSRLVGSLVVTWGISWLTFKGIEMPFLRLKSHLTTYAGRGGWPRQRAADL